MNDFSGSLIAFFVLLFIPFLLGVGTGALFMKSKYYLIKEECLAETPRKQECISYYRAVDTDR